jgi:L-ascorbate metabolism protein UlaG (beta-lactamase superfamily)
MMNRRRFNHMLFALLKASLAAGLLPPSAAGALNPGAEKPPLHYRPLNGRSLREIAGRKEHHGRGRFLNPLGLERQGRMWQVLSWKLFHRNRFEDSLDEQPVRPVTVEPGALGRQKGLSITYLKHASLLLQDSGERLLVDPVFDSPFWFIQDFTPLAFDPSHLPVDRVLLTHGHYDHLDTASLARLPKDTHVIAPPGYEDILEEVGLRNRTILDWYESFSDRQREITLLPCNHWTMRNPVVGPNTGLWGSYLVRSAAGPCVYISGDTAYFDGFAQIGAEFDIDVAVFNVGAYEPRWFMAQSHINPRETVQAFRELKARRLMITHWGSFRLGDEPVHFPPRHIRSEMQAAGLSQHLVEWAHGDTVAL